MQPFIIILVLHGFEKLYSQVLLYWFYAWQKLLNFNSEMNMMYIIEKVYWSHSLYKYIFLNAVIDLDTQKYCHDIDP